MSDIEIIRILNQHKSRLQNENQKWLKQMLDGDENAKQYYEDNLEQIKRTNNHIQDEVGNTEQNKGNVE